ncbi:MAG: alpha/beta hydrolase [Anaerolineales bacterium]
MSAEKKETGQLVDANGIKIYYQSFGSGRPLIFLHGSMGTGQVWKSYVPFLSKDFNLIFPDVRGHGKTENPGEELALHLMADDMAALIEALKLDKPILCGWSMGGDISLDIAMRYPDHVGGLIVGGVALRDTEAALASLKAMGLDGPGQINFERAEKNIPQLLELWKKDHTQSPLHWKELLKKLSFEMLNPTLPVEDDLKQITAPTLIIWGDRDQFLPVEDAVFLYRLIPNAQLAVVPNADHFVTRTKIPLFAELVKGFVLSQ